MFIHTRYLGEARRRRIMTFTIFIRVRLLKWNWIRLGDKRPFPFICGPIEREERKEGRRSSVSQGRGREREGGRGFISPEHGSPINQGRFLSPAASAALGLRASRHPRGERERESERESIREANRPLSSFSSVFSLLLFALFRTPLS